MIISNNFSAFKQNEVANFLRLNDKNWKYILSLPHGGESFMSVLLELLNLFRMGIFGAAHGWEGGEGLETPPSIKSATNILQ